MILRFLFQPSRRSLVNWGIRLGVRNETLNTRNPEPVCSRTGG